MGLTITKILCPTNKYAIKCPYSMTPQGITIHNTANDASAKAEVSYMLGNNNQVSFHDAVDDYQVVNGIEHNRNAWHSGDGSKGFGNRNTIGIEICYSKSGGERFIKAEQLAAEYIAYLMKQYGWGLDRIEDKRIGTHKDRSGKYCPHRTLDMGLDRFYNMIKTEYYEITGTTSNTAKLYRVQLGAYKIKGNAQKMALELNRKGIDTYIVKINDLYKVQCGAYSNKKNALNMQNKLKALGYKTFIPGLENAAPSFIEGQVVTLKTNATNYATGQKIPNSVKGKEYTIQQIGNGKVLLKEIYSWVLIKDIQK